MSLNASHTGCRYYPSGPSLQTAELGLLYDSHYRGDGLKVAEVIKRAALCREKYRGHSGMYHQENRWATDSP